MGWSTLESNTPLVFESKKAWPLMTPFIEEGPSALVGLGVEAVMTLSSSELVVGTVVGYKEGLTVFALAVG